MFNHAEIEQSKKLELLKSFDDNLLGAGGTRRSG